MKKYTSEQLANYVETSPRYVRKKANKAKTLNQNYIIIKDETYYFRKKLVGKGYEFCKTPFNELSTDIVRVFNTNELSNLIKISQPFISQKIANSKTLNQNYIIIKDETYYFRKKLVGKGYEFCKTPFNKLSTDIVRVFNTQELSLFLKTIEQYVRKKANKAKDSNQNHIIIKDETYYFRKKLVGKGYEFCKTPFNKLSNSDESAYIKDKTITLKFQISILVKII